MLKSQILEMFPIGPEFPDHRRFDPVTAISGGLGVATNLAGGFLGRSASKKASEAQARAATEAKDLVGNAIGDANKGIASATQSAQELATASGQQSTATAERAAQGVTNAAGQANLLLNPYTDLGSSAAGALQSSIGDMGKMPTLDQLQMDPGYAFRAQQGEIALNRSAAARGGAISGEALKSLAGYSQGLASQEYQNAFNRFRQSSQDRFSNLSTLAGQGMNAAGRQGDNLTGAAGQSGNFLQQGAAASQQANEFAATAGMNGAGQIGANTMGGAQTQADLLTQKGNAQASGIVGGANALTAGLTGAANAGSSAVMMNLLQNPATQNKTTINNSSGFFR